MASAAHDESCSVCLTEAKDPRRVPCGNGHVFCLSCLQGLVTHAKNVQNSSFPCPCCRNRVTIPPGGVAAFSSVAETGYSDSPQPAPKHRPKPTPLPRRFLNGHRDARPRFAPTAAKQDRDGLGSLSRHRFTNTSQGPGFLPSPLRPPRGMTNPFDNPQLDLEMDVPEHSQEVENHSQRHFRSFQRLFERPYALSSILSGVQSGLLSAPLPDPSRRNPGHELVPGGRRGRRGVPGGVGSSSDDLDMDEVMLVIAQMEEEEQKAAADREQDQDALLWMQNQINEEEDFLEDLCQQ